MVGSVGGAGSVSFTPIVLNSSQANGVNPVNALQGGDRGMNDAGSKGQAIQSTAQPLSIEPGKGLNSDLLA